MQRRSLYPIRDMRPAGVVFSCTGGPIGAAKVAVRPGARANAMAHLVNVAERPGYNFANADKALSYGHAMSDRVSAGCSYAQVVGDVKADFNTADEYQASFLTSQAVNKHCPALIRLMRSSPVHYRPPVTAGG
jgi:hypothetical protein